MIHENTDFVYTLKGHKLTRVLLFFILIFLFC